MIEGQTGFLVTPEDSAAFADRVIQLLRDPALSARIGAAARQHVTANFTSARYADQFVAVVDSLPPRD